jgi:3-oxoacyl-[acyl-carrier protein] reductase
MSGIGKTAVITGASRGIGRETARLMAQEGYNVVINYNHSETEAAFLYEQLKAQNLSVMMYRADVSDRQQVKSMVEECIKTYGRIDVLVNNAGMAKSGMFLEISDYEWDLMTAVQLKSLFNCCKCVIPYMMKRKYGRIINVSSAWAITGGTCEVHYSTAKAAIIGFTKALSKELAPSNISVNCITPGVVETDMLKSLTSAELEELQRDIPIQKFEKPEEIAISILSLATGSPNYITGQVLSSQGGFAV